MTQAALSPEPTPRTARAASTRERLLRAAGTVLAEHGYSATRIADIVHAAGVSHGNFYRHFQNKDDVVVAVLEPLLDELVEPFVRALAESRDDLESMVRVNTDFFSAYARHRRLFPLLREAAAVSPSFTGMWLDLRARFTGRITAWLEAIGAAPPEAAADPALLAQSLGAMTEQLAYTQIGKSPQLPRPETIAELGRVAGTIWHRSIGSRA
ncbi:MAG TPA: TetR/AcrR family transcriptional regulator [Candidatus Dormibacteraeota bacterium]|jgi:AcrR family transcriptional regulator|nr:TetR/AcrR family transcriptional regulator [Candidatus Dormibacteraeota bacterium]